MAMMDLYGQCRTLGHRLQPTIPQKRETHTHFTHRYLLRRTHQTQHLDSYNHQAPFPLTNKTVSQKNRKERQNKRGDLYNSLPHLPINSLRTQKPVSFHELSQAISHKTTVCRFPLFSSLPQHTCVDLHGSSLLRSVSMDACMHVAWVIYR
jgi:hypothetical protein